MACPVHVQKPPTGKHAYGSLEIFLTSANSVLIYKETIACDISSVAAPEPELKGAASFGRSRNRSRNFALLYSMVGAGAGTAAAAAGAGAATAGDGAGVA
jgi:hypothetical protein